MGNEIELISDGDGLAVIGKSTDVERFLVSEGLSPYRESSQFGTAIRVAASAARSGSEIAANSGRWVKLTEESAQAVKKFGLMETKTPGVSHAMVGQPGEIKQWIQIVTSPASMATNPAVLAGAAGIMAQFAMQQAMDEITDYLERIDEKLDDVLRAQTNQVMARMDGVALAIGEAMSVRETVGRVSEVTWSKVQNSAQTIHETEGYALRQLGDLADKIEHKSKIGELAKVGKDAEAEVEKWLSVLARCLQLNDAVSVLELDRVLDAAPDDLDRHRVGLRAARRDRLDLISRRTDDLVARMKVAVGMANAKVLLHPTASPAVVESSNRVATDVYEFHGVVGIESHRESSEARPWREAAAEGWETVRETGADSVDTVKRFGNRTGGQARSVWDKLSEVVAERTRSGDSESAERDE